MFFLKNYIYFTTSLQSTRELKEYAKSLEQRTLKIGKTFPIRWVEFSFKTVRAVWNSCAVLHKGFLEESLDNTRKIKVFRFK